MLVIILLVIAFIRSKECEDLVVTFSELRDRALLKNKYVVMEGIVGVFLHHS